MWQFTGNQRPSFAIEPNGGQESVWDYPRPPVCVEDSRVVVVRYGDLLIAETTNAVRILETASPPTFYIPPADVNLDLLVKASGRMVVNRIREQIDREKKHIDETQHCPAVTL